MKLREVFGRCRAFFIYAMLFSFAVNLLVLAPSLYMLQVFDRVLSSRSNATLAVLTGIFFCALALEAKLDGLRGRLFVRLGDTIYAQLRGPALDAVLRFQKQGRINKHGLEDLETLKSFLSGAGIKAFFEVPWIPFFILILWLFHPSLAAIAVCGAVALFALTVMEEAVTSANQREASAKQRDSSDFINRAFQNAEVVAALSMQDRIQQRFRTINDAYLTESFLARRKVGLIVGLSKFLRNALQIGAMAIAAYLVINVQGVSPGVMIASTIVMGKALSPIQSVIASWRLFINFRDAYRRLDELLADQQALRDGFRHPSPQGRLQVESLLFFLDRDRTILNGIHFELAPGEVLGVIGNSAAGKTTLARLLVGVLKPSDGAVRLDGVDVFQWSQNGLGEHIGYLPQDQQLFSGTVAENIARMGDAYSQVDAVVHAARRAGIHDYIVRLPKGYDTEVGIGGSELSGGQRQLVGLARALFGDPAIVVMDEPNSNLDGQSEQILLDVIRNMKQAGITVVIVTHKPSILQDADKLLVLANSRQQMFGPRDEIMARLGSMNGMVSASGERGDARRSAA